MTMTADHAALETHASKANDEPWAIWAGLMVFLNVFVIAGMTNGLAGLVAVMVVAALAMLAVLLRIVTEGM